MNYEKYKIENIYKIICRLIYIMTTKTISPNSKLSEYIKTYLASSDRGDELEIRFGTKHWNPITKIDFNNVISKLKSMGFENKSGEDYHLNINNEYNDPRTGQRRISNIRTAISGLEKIQSYCKKNTLDPETLGFGTWGIVFEKKTIKYHNGDKLGPIDFHKFQFRVNYKQEKKLKPEFNLVQTMLSKWNDSKKVFRFIKRFTFTHSDYPLKVDCSIVRTSKTRPTKFGATMIPEFRIESSNLFQNQEHFEIEIEVVKNMTPHIYQITETYLSKIKHIIKLVMAGLQGSNFPISYEEQDAITDNYMEIINPKNTPERRIRTSDFIGPQSVSLEMTNVSPIDEDARIPNIRQPYTVTDKADGVRKLMFIHKTGKIYFIDVNMKVQFTGVITKNKDIHNTIIDGEHVLHDKIGKFINLYLAFDIYYLNNKDIRRLPFIKKIIKSGEEEKTSGRNRLETLRDHVFKNLELSPIIGSLMPITIRTKTFYISEGDDIFKNCNTILNHENENLFDYEIDGLIFTPSNTAVGNIQENENLPNSKNTWWESFKWKPSKYNTIDFLVTTQKDDSGEDVVGNIFQDGENMQIQTQLTEYKTLELRVGFDERRHGYLNPCSDVINDNLPSRRRRDEHGKNYQPALFYPTDPTPLYPAYVCNIILQNKGGVRYMMTEDGKSVIEDGTIVEFRYELDEKKFWQWKPIRVRDKKTAEYKAGGSNYGNAYHVAQSIWKSIHNPVTKEMITSGANIPDELVDDDVYYNRKGKTITKSLRDFHNLFVKKLLITATSKKGGTLIDMSVGKGGDFPKWIKAKLGFVFGLDLSRDNIENRLDGACARFLSNKKKFYSMPYALFVQANSGLNIRSGEACFTEKGKEITKAVFGNGAQDSEKLGAGVMRQFGKGKDGFDVVSNQFSIHYFFENLTILSEFLRNVSECCKVGGYFIGTSYDGRKVFQHLEDKVVGESIHIIKNQVKMWEIKKEYSAKTFENNSNSIGFKVEVYQESINKAFPEYLVNYEYLIEIMENFGFVLPSKKEAQELGLPNSMGNFNEMFDYMEEMVSTRRMKKSDVGSALSMSASEKNISFLNKYFVFKKVRDVDANQISRILSGISEVQDIEDVKESLQLQQAIESSKPKKTLKARKLGKKLKIKAKDPNEPIVTSQKKIKIKRRKKKLKLKE
jgi:hypothetical protein